jgi:CHRD domain-containing protein
VRVAASEKSAYLTGRAEIGKDGRRGAGDPDAKGTAVFQLVDEQTICYGFTLDNADTPGIVHIHRGAPGRNGPPVIVFANVPKNAQGQPSGDPGTSSGCKALTTPEELAALKELRKHPRNFYVNMHTTAFPDGAVRGQLSHLLFSNR